MSSKGRTHIVLIPGFAGFDALGQMQYYAGVTEQYRQWCGITQGNSANHAAFELHYFDNFPTASVETRSKRLLQYLAKRVARGTFTIGDQVALVGHSTGGLDIRRMIWDLNDSHERQEDIFVDGCRIKASEILALVSRIVFISVPQFGTNLANRIHGNFLLREAIISELRTVLAASQMPVVDRIQHFFSNCTSAALNLDLGLAVQDALNESAAGGSRDAMGTALAQEAASELALWLRHMAWDFSVVDDLAITTKSGSSRKRGGATSGAASSSPAHFTAEMRQTEQSTWKKFSIAPLSLVTIAKSPKDRARRIVADTYTEFSEFSPGAVTGNTVDTSTDITFDWCYDATTRNVPSKILQSQVAPKYLWTAGSTAERKIEAGDNDGIVNTASMLWPTSHPTFLVECDHMDIVGHYKRVPMAHTTSDADDSRKYLAYDLLKSGSGFDDQAFRQVWSSVFDFCSQSQPVAAGNSANEAGR